MNECALQETCLESQSQRSVSFCDRVACFGDIDIEDGFASDLFEIGLRSEGRDEPAFVRRCQCPRFTTYQIVATPYWLLVRTTNRELLPCSECDWDFTHARGCRTSCLPRIPTRQVRDSAMEAGECRRDQTNMIRLHWSKRYGRDL